MGYWIKKRKFFWQKRRTIFFKDFLNENIKMLRNTHLRNTINELSKEKSKKQIGNLYFSPQKKFIIDHFDQVKPYAGYTKDGNLIAVYRFQKMNNNNNIMKSYRSLQDPKLEGIINRYAGLEEDRKYIYLAVILWDYSLDEYIKTIPVPEMNPKTIFCKILHGLRSLHQAGVIHGDINPRAFFIDSENNIRLNIFNRNLLEDHVDENIYSTSCDIKAAGKLLYYILTHGKHPFGEIYNNVEDIEAQDLIEWMIDNDPTINEVLKHPYFWDINRKEEVIRKLGDRYEVQYYIDISKICKMRKADEDLIKAVERVFNNKKKSAILKILGETKDIQDENFTKLCKLCNNVEKYTHGKMFNKWKSQLSALWSDINKDVPEDLFGLLRVLRNKITHCMGFDEKIFDHFPDFFISLHRLANDMGWDCTWS